MQKQQGRSSKSCQTATTGGKRENSLFSRGTRTKNNNKCNTGNMVGGKMQWQEGESSSTRWLKCGKIYFHNDREGESYSKYSVSTAAQQAYHGSSPSRYSSRQTNFPAVRFVHFRGAEQSRVLWPGAQSPARTRSIASFREPDLRVAGRIIRILAQLFGKSRRNGAIISIKIDGTTRLMMRRVVLAPMSTMVH